MLGGALHTRRIPAPLWSAIAAISLLGLGLRVLAARGDLWLDEAWSATFAEEVVTPLGVIWQINHDNNHILNTLWLQWLGPEASPILQRALAIVTGSVAIPLAAVFCWRRSATAGLIAALFFAVSPILVTYGSEARGYAPMLAAALASLVIIDAWLERNAAPSRISLSILALLGALAQVLMIAPLLALTAWAGITLWRRNGFRHALFSVIQSLGPALLCAALVISVMALAAYHAPNGFTIGAYTPFSRSAWLGGIGEATRWTLAFPRSAPFAAAIGLITTSGLLWLRRHDPRAPFYGLLILALPLGYFALRVGNVAIARYYLPAAVCLLLIAADALGSTRGRLRWIAILVVLMFTIGAISLDARQIRDRRADPGAAIAAMRQVAPGGATMILPDKRMMPVFKLAARSAQYPLSVVGTRCTPAPFLLLDEGQPASLRLCCGAYRLIAERNKHGLSGTSWRLYRRMTP